MSAIENLQTAVTDNATATADGFAAVNSAMEELASDIQNLPQAADVQAEAERLAANTEVIRNATATLAQAVRDAIPTAPVEQPEA